MDVSSDVDVMTSSTLIQLHKLHQLFSGKIPFLSIDNYRQYNNLEEIKQRIYQSKKSSYKYEDNLVSHIGFSSYCIDDQADRFQQYYSQVDENIQALKKLFSPNKDPIIAVIMGLRAVWKPGVEIAMLHGKKMFAGIVRIIHKGSMIHAHQDLVAWSNPKAINKESVLGQFGMNFFIQVPQQGGRLMMWEQSLSQAAFDDASQGDFCIPVSKLPAPNWFLKPSLGTLTLINARHLHAIEAPLDNDRIAVSCFIGYQGNDKPLLLWS